jgi:hypothetical protein
MKCQTGVPSGIGGGLAISRLSKTGMLAARKQSPSRTPAIQGRHFFIVGSIFLVGW